MDLPYTHLTEADYDTKLREIGNYLWELEQELLTADAAQDEAKALQVHEKISRLTAKADRFFEVPGEHRLLAAYVSGLGLRIIGQWADASDRFLRVLKLSPANGEAWLELSWCLAETEHWEECEMAARSSLGKPSSSSGKARPVFRSPLRCPDRSPPGSSRSTLPRPSDQARGHRHGRLR